MSKQTKSTEWLENLRINSFEIEILLVGFVLILLFQLPDVYASYFNVLNRFDFYNITSVVMASSFVFLILGLYFITKILIITFIIYLISRGIWVSVIGLSSVYKDGIDRKKLNFFSRYKPIILKLNFDVYAKKIDNFCSSIFAISFLIIFIFSSLIIFIIQLMFILSISVSLEEAGFELFDELMMYAFYVYLFCMGFFLFDILFFGLIKKIKIKWIGNLYYHIQRVYRVSTLFYLYEHLYYHIISNISKKTIILLIIFSSTLAYIIFTVDDDIKYFSYNDDGSYINSYYYLDELIDIYLLDKSRFIGDDGEDEPYINSRTIFNNSMDIFIPYQPEINSFLKLDCDGIVYFNDIADSLEFENEQLILDCLNQFYKVHIDSTEQHVDFLFSQHPLTNREGFFTSIYLKKLNIGKHLLKINHHAKDSSDRISNYSIPFYYYPK